MKVWDTKLALTKGIVEDEVAIFGSIIKGERLYYRHREGKDWHRTREQAVIRAEELRELEIARLRTKLMRLEGMKFS